MNIAGYFAAHGSHVATEWLITPRHINGVIFSLLSWTDRLISSIAPRRVR